MGVAEWCIAYRKRGWKSCILAMERAVSTHLSIKIELAHLVTVGHLVRSGKSRSFYQIQVPPSPVFLSHVETCQ